VTTSLDEARDIAAQALADDAPTWQVIVVRYGTRMGTRGGMYVDDGTLDDPDAPLQMDYFFWLLRGDDETILVDSGFHPEAGARRGRTTLVPPLEALDRLAIRSDTIGRVVVTHLHYDHTGQLSAFPDAELIVQRRDVEFWGAPDLDDDHTVHIEADDVAYVAAAIERGRARVLDGAAMITPGVGAVLVGGHSPGQQCLVVKGEQGPVLLASDAVHYYEELEQRLPFAIYTDLEEMARGYELLESLAEHTGAALVPGHDPAVADRYPATGSLLPALAVRVG